MRRDYTVLLTTLIVFTFVISGFLLLGTLDATQTDPFDCEKRIQHECPLKKEGQQPECCPNPRPPCQLGNQGNPPAPLVSGETGIRRIDK